MFFLSSILLTSLFSILPQEDSLQSPARESLMKLADFSATVEDLRDRDGFAYRSFFYNNIDDAKKELDYIKNVLHKDINSISPTPLMVAAAQGGNIDMVEYLIESGARLDVKDNNGDDVIAWAMRGSNASKLEMLLNSALESGMVFNLNASLPGKKYSYFNICVANSHNIDVVEMLVDKYGAEIDGQGGAQFPAIICAAAFNEDIVSGMLDRFPNMDVNATDLTSNTALVYALYLHRWAPEVAISLIRYGAKCDITLEQAGPLILWVKHAEVLEEFIAEGVDINQAYKGDTILHRLAQDDHDSTFDDNLLRVLNENGIDLNKENSDGFTPLYLAMLESDYGAFNSYNNGFIQDLLQFGAKINIAYGDEQASLLHKLFDRKSATRESNPDFYLPLLIKFGANVNARNKKNTTPLMYAAASAPLRQVKKMLDAGSDINLVNDNGMTALMFASGESKNPDVVSALLEAGAVVEATSKSGKSALDYAVNNADIYRTEAYWELCDLFYTELLEEKPGKLSKHGEVRKSPFKTEDTDSMFFWAISLNRAMQVLFLDADYILAEGDFIENPPRLTQAMTRDLVMNGLIETFSEVEEHYLDQISYSFSDTFISLFKDLPESLSSLPIETEEWWVDFDYASLSLFSQESFPGWLHLMNSNRENIISMFGDEPELQETATAFFQVINVLELMKDPADSRHMLNFESMGDTTKFLQSNRMAQYLEALAALDFTSFSGKPIEVSLNRYLSMKKELVRGLLRISEGKNSEQIKQLYQDEKYFFEYLLRISNQFLDKNGDLLTDWLAKKRIAESERSIRAPMRVLKRLEEINE